MRLEAKHQYFKRLVSQMNWNGDVAVTLAKRHSRYLALTFHQNVATGPESAVVSIGDQTEFTQNLHDGTTLSALVLGHPIVASRIGSVAQHVPMIEHSKLSYANRIIYEGAMIQLRAADGIVFGKVQRVYSVVDVYVLTYHRCIGNAALKNGHMVLPTLETSIEVDFVQLNTQDLTLIHAHFLEGEWHLAV